MSSEVSNTDSGAIAWMTRHPVTANLFMLILLLGGGIIIVTQVKQEVEPNFEVDMVSIDVPYPGAAPSEVEKGIILAVEEAIRGLDGIKKIRSTAHDGNGNVQVELLNDADINKVTADIKNAVDRISSFPLDAERPLVKTFTTGREVVGMILYGGRDEKVLSHLAETVRDDLLKEENITKVELRGIRPREINIEISREQLRAYGLTIDGVASKIASSTVELPGGGVKTSSGEVLIRTTERREYGHEFHNLSMLSAKDGTRVRLGEIATVTDGFEEIETEGFYNGEQSVWIRVFRVGEETPMEVSAAVTGYVKHLNKELPPDIKVAFLFDQSESFHDRIDLLKRNAVIGLFLVLGILGLFLEIRLAFWVTMGIPISFLGSFIFLPAVDVSINMYSLFAFIVTLGMVVDDAIIIGENIYVHRQEGKAPIEASILGAREVAVPVVFSILTTIVAFSPMLYMPGLWGKFFRIMPLVIITVLLLSLFESLFILPAHLGHLKDPKETGISGALYHMQQWVGKGVETFARKVYGPLVKAAVSHQWITGAVAIACLMITNGIVQGGRIEIEYFPAMDTGWVTANAKLPFGVPVAETKNVKRIMEQSVREVAEAYLEKHGSPLYRGMYSYYLGTDSIMVFVTLVRIEERKISSAEFVERWREKMGVVPGVESLVLDATFGSTMGGKPIDVQLSHKDIRVLELASKDLARDLKKYAGVRDIDDGFAAAKPQLNLKLKPEAFSLGLTVYEVGRQVRGAFWGAEALRQQRGRDMIRVMVRLPKAERNSEYDIEKMLVNIPGGGEVPLSRVVEVQRGKSFPSITRTDGQRTIRITAEVETATANAKEIIGSLVKTNLPDLLKKYPGLSYSFEGAEKSGGDAINSLVSGFVVALLIMYILIAIPFGSYIQPVVVLSAIPFGFVGAIIGHMVMGYNLSIISMMGLVALSGVVVNDSLVLIHTANRNLEKGMDHKEAAVSAGIRRFRPIMLTSVTTFLGLSPMIFETSVQARSLIPMAISLGFGVLFATVIVLLIVPSFYIIVQDINDIFSEVFRDSLKIFNLPKMIIKVLRRKN
ncbi:MAG: efflux RND transporter permease subunit [Proteobacteria bacterium]|nr:efflux RND transporter permease subunit [Pseudomonadota bacterium]